MFVHIVLAYAVSARYYVYEAMPPCPTCIHRRQRAVDRVLARAVLWMSVDGGGLGFPHLYSRMRLRHVLGFFWAMDSRSVLVRENVSTLRHRDHWKGTGNPDHKLLHHTMAEVKQEMHVLLAVAAQLAAVNVGVFRPYVSGGVLTAANGLMEVTPERETPGWGAVVAGNARILA